MTPTLIAATLAFLFTTVKLITVRNEVEAITAVGWAIITAALIYAAIMIQIYG